mmetsp:Transcript_15361/g.27308  ORF Transcript_15361/g.27308 Transcript_15361/m.27308 type:complete len:207 (-) Transcript_15361:607-1227(-)
MGRLCDQRAIMLVRPEVALHFLQQRRVRTFGVDAFFVHVREDSCGLSSFNEVTHDLIVEKADFLPPDALARVLVLLRFEGELNKKLLQLFIAVVDAKLLERVGLEYLKPVDIKHTQGKLPHVGVDGDVDEVNQVQKVTRVERLGEGISSLDAFIDRGQRRSDRLGSRRNGSVRDGPLKVFRTNVEELCSLFYFLGGARAHAAAFSS